MEPVEHGEAIEVQSLFERDNEAINAKYASQLPAPSESLQVSTVAILHNEFSNDSFWRLLKSAYTQTDVNRDTYELLLVVNNSEKQSKSKSEGFQDNQQALRVLSAIREGQDRMRERDDLFLFEDLLSSHHILGLSEHELSIMRKAISSQVNVYGIDASSPDMSIRLSKDDNIRGIARNIGGHIAYSRLSRISQEADGVIDFVDGDCYLQSNYYHEMLKKSQSEQSRVLVKPVLSRNPDLPDYIAEARIPPEAKLANIIQYLRGSLLNTRLRFLRKPAISGQQLAITPDLFKQVGGYVTDKYQEDWEFATKVDLYEKISNGTTLDETAVYLSDRKREGSVDGYTEGKVKSMRLEDMDPHNPRNVSSIRGKLLSLLIEDDELSSNVEYIRHRKEFFRREKLERLLFIKTAEKVLGFGLQSYDGSYKGKGFFTRLLKSRNLFEEGLKKHLNNQEFDFIESNPVLVDCIQAVAQIVEDSNSLDTLHIDRTEDDTQTAMNVLKKYLPEYFQDPSSDEPDYQDTLEKIEEEKIEDINIRDYIHLARAQFVSS